MSFTPIVKNAAYTTADATKLGHISITQAVDLDALETASHAAVTVADSAEIDFTLTGQQISASIVAGSIDESKLDASVNASLDLADTAVQPAGLSGYFQTTNIDDTPVNGETAAPISSNWAYDHAATAASDTAAGHVELAIASELNTGTDATRAVTPDGLAGSNFGIRYLQMVVFDFGTDVATGDGKFYAVIPPALNGMNLISTNAKVITAGTTGTMDIQIHNVTDAVDMLSTKMTIDSTETSTDTAATAAVIDTTKDDVVTGDILRVDVDAVQTTKAKGLIVTLGFQLP